MFTPTGDKQVTSTGATSAYQTMPSLSDVQSYWVPTLRLKTGSQVSGPVNGVWAKGSLARFNVRARRSRCEGFSSINGEARSSLDSLYTLLFLPHRLSNHLQLSLVPYPTKNHEINCPYSGFPLHLAYLGGPPISHRDMLQQLRR
jgi:hypothetical protein